MKIGFIGLGKLGGECAEYMAERHEVTGFDIQSRCLKNVTITDKIEDTVIDKSFTFIAVPTPHAPAYDGSGITSYLPPQDFNYSIVIDVLKQIQNIKSKSVIVLISTVLPGTIREKLLPYIDSTRFVYNPYLIAMGTVQEDMKDPEMIIIGTETRNNPISKDLEFFYHDICNVSRVISGTYDEAEAIKLFYNTFISMKLAFVNMIMDVSHQNGNINCDRVIKALVESTNRIMSPQYMKAGMGDGGPCHPRDNIALRTLTQKFDLGYDLFGYIMKTREHQAYNIALEMKKHNKPVVILGKSYKPEVELTDGSYSCLIGYYCQMEKITIFFDKHPKTEKGPFVYLLGHRGKFHDYDFIKGSVIVDPWGECPDINGCKVIHYGRPV